MTYQEAIKILSNLKECCKTVNQKCTMACSKCNYFENDLDIVNACDFALKVLKEDNKILTMKKEKDNEKRNTQGSL